MIDAAARGGTVAGDGVVDDIGMEGILFAAGGCIDGTALLRRVVAHQRTRHHTALEHAECAALQRLAVADDAVADVCLVGHHGSTAHALEARVVGGLAVDEVYAVHYGTVAHGIHVIVFYLARCPFAEGDGVVAVHLLCHRRTFLHLGLGAQHGLVFRDAVALVVVPVVARRRSVFRLALVVAAHQPYAVGHEEGVALRVVRVGKGVGVVDETFAVLIGLVACHLYVHLVLLAIGGDAVVHCLSLYAGCRQHALQLVGAGGVRRTVATTVAPAVLGHVVHVVGDAR